MAFVDYRIERHEGQRRGQGHFDAEQRAECRSRRILHQPQLFALLLEEGADPYHLKRHLGRVPECGDRNQARAIEMSFKTAARSCEEPSKLSPPSIYTVMTMRRYEGKVDHQLCVDVRWCMYWRRL